MRPRPRKLRPGFLVLLLCLVLLAACRGEPERSLAGPVPEGPPEVEVEAVQEHAAQFDDDLDERPAGSQQEFAAATYLTAHLQRSGYEVRFEAVPFKDTVRSTNVVALTPGGEEPSAVVTVAYDSTPSMPPLGRDLGLFLELARALRVREPNHNVQFVALGAELATDSGGNLGSRVLAGELQDFERRPPVVTVMVVPDGGFTAPGANGDELNGLARELGLLTRPSATGPVTAHHLKATAIFEQAGLSHAIAAGGIEEVGTVLLDYLSR